MPAPSVPIFDTLRPVFQHGDGSADWPVIIGACAVTALALIAIPKLTARMCRKITRRHARDRADAMERRMTDRPADPQALRTGNARETRARLAAILQLTDQALNPTRPDEQRRQSLLTAREHLRDLLDGTSDPSDAPGAAAPALAPQPAPITASNSQQLSSTLAAMRVLIADESPVTRQTLGAWLTSAGASVEPASNSRAAVDLTMKSLRSGQQYDAILIDLDVSRVDGLAAVATLRQLGYVGRIVAISSSILAAEHKRFFDAGCSTHLIKPLTMPQLLAVLAALRSNAAEAQSPTTPPQPESDDHPPLTTGSLVNDPDIQPLITEFIGGLRQHADVLTAAFQDADLARVRIVAKQLAGSAGSYGFEAITRQARAVESALQSAVADTDKMKTELETLTALCRKATAPRIIVPDDEN